MSVEKTLVIKTDKILACSSHSHPFLDAPEGVEGDRLRSGFTVGGVEGVVGCVLMEGDTLLSAPGWAGSRDEIAQLLHTIGSDLLSLHSLRILLLQQVAVTVVLPLCVANGGGGGMEEGCCGGGGDVLAEGAEERGAMMGVHRESTHQLACVLTNLREWIEGWLLLFLRFGLVATCAAPRMATEIGCVLPALAPGAHPLQQRTTAHRSAHQTHSR